jgi:hypothetical protein
MSPDPIDVITSKKEKNKGSEDIGNYVMIYCGVPANQWASSGVAIAIRKDWRHKIQDYTWILSRSRCARLRDAAVRYFGFENFPPEPVSFKVVVR